MMNIFDYPQAIADQSLKSLEINEQIQVTRDQISEIEFSIDCAVAFNTELKNDTQRKNARIQLVKDSDDHAALSKSLKDLAHSQATNSIHLEFLKNQFTVAKLELQSKLG